MTSPEYWRDSSIRYRTLADAVTDDRARTELLKLAAEYDERAERMEWMGIESLDPEEFSIDDVNAVLGGAFPPG